MNKEIISTIVCLLLSQNLIAQGERYYVAPTAFGANNGTSWTDAFTDLHDALALAEAGDEIWVAEGLYHPSAAGNRSVRFEILSGVRLYGGFAGTELDLSERDWQAHPSILDGDIGAAGDSTDNSYNLLYLYRPDSLTVVDGFTFQNALANDPAAPAGTVGSSGAALYIMALDGEAYPEIRNCGFEHNTALKHGGAVYINAGGSGSAAPLFENCRFTANRAVQGNGGAIYRFGGSWVDQPEDIRVCVFEGNLASRQGGAIYFADSPRTDKFDITRTIFRHNRVIVPLGAPGVNSGSVLFATLTRLDAATKLSVRNCQVIDNRNLGSLSAQWSSAPFATAPQAFEAGNLVFHFDSVYFEYNKGTCFGESFGWSRILMYRSTFYKDTINTNVSFYDVVDNDTSKVIDSKFLYSEGGITTSSSTLLVENVTCAYNLNPGFGMNYLLMEAKIIANNLVSYGNTFTSYNYNNGAEYKGGVILAPLAYNFGPLKGTVWLSNSSIYDSPIVGYSVNLTEVCYRNNAFFLKDTLFLPPFNSFLQNSVQTAVFENNLINQPDTFNAPIWIKSGNLWNTNPQFINPDSGVLRLHPCSPAIDAGNNETVQGLMNLVIDIRREARGKKDFATSDKIRDALGSIGIQLKDEKDGSVSWGLL